MGNDYEPSCASVALDRLRPRVALINCKPAFNVINVSVYAHHVSGIASVSVGRPMHRDRW